MREGETLFFGVWWESSIGQEGAEINTRICHSSVTGSHYSHYCRPTISHEKPNRMSKKPANQSWNDSQNKENSEQKKCSPVGLEDAPPPKTLAVVPEEAAVVVLADPPIPKFDIAKRL